MTTAPDTHTPASTPMTPTILITPTNQPVPRIQSTLNTSDIIAQSARNREAEERELLGILEDCLNSDNTKKAYRGHQQRFMKCAETGRDITVNASELTF